MKGLLATVLLVAVAAGIFFFSWVGKNDHEVQLKTQVVSQQEVCKAKFNDMFASISQVAQVPAEFMEQSKEAFKEIYTPLIEGRYRDEEGKQKQVLMNWIQESNPEFDLNASAGLYKKIQDVIEIKRNEFFTEQKKLISVHQEHTIFVSTFMNKNLFMMGDRLIETCQGEVDETDPNYVFCVQLIETKEGKQTYKTGVEEDLSVF